MYGGEGSKRGFYFFPSHASQRQNLPNKYYNAWCPKKNLLILWHNDIFCRFRPNLWANPLDAWWLLVRACLLLPNMALISWRRKRRRRDWKKSGGGEGLGGRGKALLSPFGIEGMQGRNSPSAVLREKRRERAKIGWRKEEIDGPQPITCAQRQFRKIGRNNFGPFKQVKRSSRIYTIYTVKYTKKYSILLLASSSGGELSSPPCD